MAGLVAATGLGRVEAHLCTHPQHETRREFGEDSKPISDLGTWAESQQIVATRPLYCLQYPVSSQSSAEDLT